MRGHREVIQCLMERGVELDTTDHRGKTPAHYAAKHGSRECLKALMKSAVDINTGMCVREYNYIKWSAINFSYRLSLNKIYFSQVIVMARNQYTKLLLQIVWRLSSCCTGKVPG